MKLNAKSNKFLTTFTIILGLMILYVHQMSPAPVMGALSEEFGVTSDVLLNLSISITYPMTVIFSLLGPAIEQKIGTRKLYTLSLIIGSLGLLINFVIPNYTFFLIGRAMYGISFGLAMPFFGNAIAKWYSDRQKEALNTVNGLYPFIGTIICYGVMFPLYELFSNSNKGAYGIWGVFLLVLLIIWLFLKEPESEEAEESESSVGLSVFPDLLKRKTIRLLCYTFVCDFTCYSFIAAKLPTYLYELSGGSFSEATSGLIAAFVFPGVGILGGSLGGIYMSKTGLRKPSMLLGQILKFIGFLLAGFGADISIFVVLVGVAVFGIGNALWVPAMYTVPLDLEGMTPAHVGGAFSLITSSGFMIGSIGTVVFGAVTTVFMNASGIADPIASHAYGLKCCILILSSLSLLSTALIAMVKESGTRRNKK